ncbi:MAG: hypothetical protein AB8G99_10605 [Planctomycetaceae bacterium]
MSTPQLSIEQATSLEENLGQSLAQIHESIELLTEMETVLPTASPTRVGELLQILQQRQGHSETLATERALIMARVSVPETGLSASVLLDALPKEVDQPQFSERLHKLRTALGTLRRRKERVWTIISVRSCVIDMTLSVLTGGTTYGYDAQGKHSVSRSRPIFQHRC